MQIKTLRMAEEASRVVVKVRKQKHHVMLSSTSTRRLNSDVTFRITRISWGRSYKKNSQKSNSTPLIKWQKIWITRSTLTLSSNWDKLSRQLSCLASSTKSLNGGRACKDKQMSMWETKSKSFSKVLLSTCNRIRTLKQRLKYEKSNSSRRWCWGVCANRTVNSSLTWFK